MFENGNDGCWGTRDVGAFPRGDAQHYKNGVTQTGMVGVSHTATLGLSHTDFVAQNEPYARVRRKWAMPKPR